MSEFAPYIKQNELLIKRNGQLERLVNRIKDALGTAEIDDALIEVASNAHKAEQELAALVTKCPDCKMRIEERSKDFERRVFVEQFLLDCFHGKCSLPDKDQCRMLANRLGIPDEYRRNDGH